MNDKIFVSFYLVLITDNVHVMQCRPSPPPRQNQQQSINILLRKSRDRPLATNHCVSHTVFYHNTALFNSLLFNSLFVVSLAAPNSFQRLFHVQSREIYLFWNSLIQKTHQYPVLPIHPSAYE